MILIWSYSNSIYDHASHKVIKTLLSQLKYTFHYSLKHDRYYIVGNYRHIYK